MKTPKEIKKWLECCSNKNMRCRKGCPYVDDGSLDALIPDALAYIRQLEQIIADFAERTAQLETQVPKWISVEDRLPDKQCDHLVLYSFGETAIQYFSGVMYFVLYDERPHFENDGLYDMRVTHWMPLPELPKEEEKHD